MDLERLWAYAGGRLASAGHDYYAFDCPASAGLFFATGSEIQMASPRVKKTKAQIERIIIERCQAEGVQVGAVMVLRSEMYEWEASFVAAPRTVISNPDHFETIVQALRELYELKD
jgi:hypothetical protein